MESGVFWSSKFLNLSGLPLLFGLILTVASRLLHPCYTDDQLSRLLEKRFSTVRDTQGGTQSYIEKRREKREREVTRSRRGGIKMGETDLAIISSLSVLHSLDPSEMFTKLQRRGR